MMAKVLPLGFNKIGVSQTILAIAFSLFSLPSYSLDTDIALSYRGYFEDSAFESFNSSSNHARSDYSAHWGVEAGVAHSLSLSDSCWFELDISFQYDEYDHNLNRFDADTLAIQCSGENLDVSIGVKTEFWGVTESRHLVDIINQTNIAKNIDEESKLGQPMIKLQLYRSWGSMQFYWMPYFIERVFPDANARMRTALPVNDQKYYTPLEGAFEINSAKKYRDLALRYSHTWGEWDIGTSYFHGTSREPLLIPEFDAITGEGTLVPLYDVVEQTSLDLQRTSDNLLLKLEAIYRDGDVSAAYHAVALGAEYTQVGIAGSAVDLGYIVEYLYDERGATATTPFEDDLFAGLRFVFNNIAQTTLLVGGYFDSGSNENAWRLELEHRLSDGLTLSLEGQIFNNIQETSLLSHFEDDDYLGLELHWYF